MSVGPDQNRPNPIPQLYKDTIAYSGSGRAASVQAGTADPAAIAHAAPFENPSASHGVPAAAKLLSHDVFPKRAL
jgi:hypothetical protein